jgi:hypothetical protein
MGKMDRVQSDLVLEIDIPLASDDLLLKVI